MFSVMLAFRVNLTGSSSGNVLKLVRGLPFSAIPLMDTQSGSVDFGEGGVKLPTAELIRTNQISFLYLVSSENNSTARVTLKGNQIGDAYINPWSNIILALKPITRNLLSM